MKKFALIVALLVSSITAASAASHSYAPTNAQDAYFDRTVDVGENGGGGGN
jgi:opacity protein-like surface antigen